MSPRSWAVHLPPQGLKCKVAAKGHPGHLWQLSLLGADVEETLETRRWVSSTHLLSGCSGDWDVQGSGPSYGEGLNHVSSHGGRQKAQRA